MPTARKVDIGDGLRVPAEISRTWDDIGGVAVDLAAAYDTSTGRYVARQVVVRGAEVTSETIRAVPVAGLVRHLVAEKVAPLFAPPNLDPAALGRAGPSDDTLRHVARTYRLALLFSDAPTQRVAESLAVPRSTAGRWVTRARDRGYLTVTDPRASRER